MLVYMRTLTYYNNEQCQTSSENIISRIATYTSRVYELRQHESIYMEIVIARMQVQIARWSAHYKLNT